jgi:hypothetical protein
VLKTLIIAVIGLLFTTNAMAFCSEPSAPWGKPSKPTVPYCVNEYTNTHTCSDWEIDNYYSDLESYSYDVQSYIRQLNDYIDEAVEYAQCEVNSLE